MESLDIFKRLVIAACVACACFNTIACTDKSHRHKGALDGSQAKKLIADQGKQLTILDVRTPEEYTQCHLKDAVNIPVETLPEKVHTLPEGTILIVCRRGIRAHKAYHIILDALPKRRNLYYLDGTPTYNTDGIGNCMASR